MKISNFEFSSHAELRMQERGVDRNDVMNTILRPTKKSQQYRGTHGGIVCRMEKVINGKNLAVVAELYKENCYVVSAFYEDQ
jgi:uncharacterized protein DUF4258